MPTLDTLLGWTTKFEGEQKTPILRASEFYALIHDPFYLWCRVFAPKEEEVEEENRYNQLKLAKGEQFERAWVQKNYPDALEVKAERGKEAVQQTLELMLGGTPAIYQPHLWCATEGLHGKGDLIVRDDSCPSDLGNYHYTVKEIKMSNKIQPEHKLQTACYNFILGLTQGFTPLQMQIILSSKEESIVDVDYETVEEDLKKYLEFWRGICQGKIKPEPLGIDKTASPWRVYANKILMENNDLTLLPDVGPASRAMLRQRLGVNKISDLFQISQRELINKLGEKSGSAVYYHVLSYYHNRPLLAAPVPRPLTPDGRQFFFDFETSDEVSANDPFHVYLIGWCDEKGEYKYFLGQGKKDEEKIFAQFLDYLGDLNNVCLLCWSNYEQGVIDKIILEYPKLAAALIKLKSRCFDLKEIIRQHFYFPVPTYSIKKVAPYLGFSWRQKEVNAFESMVLYWDWLKNNERSLIEKVLLYNEDDCLAMLYVVKELEKGNYLQI